jgi:hypothetical protein
MSKTRVLPGTVIHHADPTTTKTGRPYGELVRWVRTWLTTNQRIKPDDHPDPAKRRALISQLSNMKSTGELKRIRKGIAHVRQPIYQRTT